MLKFKKISFWIITIKQIGLQHVCENYLMPFSAQLVMAQNFVSAPGCILKKSVSSWHNLFFSILSQGALCINCATLTALRTKRRRRAWGASAFVAAKGAVGGNISMKVHDVSGMVVYLRDEKRVCIKVCRFFFCKWSAWVENSSYDGTVSSRTSRGTTALHQQPSLVCRQVQCPSQFVYYYPLSSSPTSDRYW